MDPYNSLIEKISLLAKIPKEEIDRKVEAKRAKLSGLVSREGAAQIVAAEMGINFDKERMKISELAQGMKRANIVGKVLKIFPIREYNKNGRAGKVANMIIADDSANCRAVLWDTNHIGLIESGNIKEEDVLELSNGMVKNGELHLSSFSDIKHSNEQLGEVAKQSIVKEEKIVNLKVGQRAMTRAFIVQVFDPRYFEVCPECGKKVVDEQCIVHGKVESKKKALLSIILDDGSSSIRAVLFLEQIGLLGIAEEIFNLETFASTKTKILGEEKCFVGSLRNNQLYNTSEFFVEGIENINPEKLIEVFQKGN